MQLTEDIYTAIQDGRDPGDIVPGYWAGRMSESPRLELLVTSARVVRIVSCSDDDRNAAKRARWKLPNPKELFPGN